MRKGAVDLVLRGHTDSVTSVSLNPNGTHLLTNSMDSSIRSWDIRPFVSNENNRCELNFVGARHGAEKVLLRTSWSPNGDRVCSGSADR